MQSDVFDFLGKQLLVIESTASRRPILQRIVTRWGFECRVVAPAEAAAALHSRSDLDILVSDLAPIDAEAASVASALAKVDRERALRQLPPVVCVFISNRSRAELSHQPAGSVPRHDIFLLQPVSQPKLFDALMRAALRDLQTDAVTRPFSPEPAMAQPKPRAGEIAVAPPHLPGRALDILVAEDNEVNQRVIFGMLKNLGHRVTLVGDGRAAVTAAGNGRFDAVLMDIHMPELDGVAAMREIHVLLGSRCPPIAAMTAHALAGDREHYLDEGMDDYISKPIRKADLRALLARLSHEDAPPVASPFVAPEPAILPAAILPIDARIEALPILDTEQLEDLRYLPASSDDAGDGDSVGGLIRLFQAKGQERMALIDRSLAEGDWSVLAETAHSLRGASASMGFPRVSLLCKDLELGARARDASAEQDRAETTAVDLSAIVASIRQYYSEAETALALWLRDTMPAAAQAGNPA